MKPSADKYNFQAVKHQASNNCILDNFLWSLNSLLKKELVIFGKILNTPLNTPL